MIPALVIVGGIVLVALIWLVANYNRFARLRQHILESWSDIDVELKRQGADAEQPDAEQGGGSYEGFSEHVRLLFSLGFRLNPVGRRFYR